MVRHVFSSVNSVKVLLMKTFSQSLPTAAHARLVNICEDSFRFSAKLCFASQISASFQIHYISY